MLFKGGKERGGDWSFPSKQFFVFCCYFWHETVDKVNKERVLH